MSYYYLVDNREIIIYGDPNIKFGSCPKDYKIDLPEQGSVFIEQPFVSKKTELKSNLFGVIMNCQQIDQSNPKIKIHNIDIRWFNVDPIFNKLVKYWSSFVFKTGDSNQLKDIKSDINKLGVKNYIKHLFHVVKIDKQYEKLSRKNKEKVYNYFYKELYKRIKNIKPEVSNDIMSILMDMYTICRVLNKNGDKYNVIYVSPSHARVYDDFFKTF